tara:strand:+ start:2472 stop:2585 length:114 start_codon:yes stop_codon:yes gene_type:complete
METGEKNNVHPPQIANAFPRLGLGRRCRRLGKIMIIN